MFRRRTASYTSENQIKMCGTVFDRADALSSARECVWTTLKAAAALAVKRSECVLATLGAPMTDANKRALKTWFQDVVDEWF